ncbi:histidine kinase [bacterium]|nr:histidine kinase [bacterium]
MKLDTKRTLLLAFGVATVLILLNATQRSLASWEQTPSSPVMKFANVPADAALWYLWALSIFPIYFVASHISLRRSNRILVFLSHLGIGFSFALANICVQSLILSFVTGDAVFSLIEYGFVSRLYMRTAIYFLIVIACYAYIFHQRHREEELRAEHLESQLARLQFQMLKSKLNPEFLFNTMQSISGLIRKDIESADLLTARLGDFLRISLENSCAGQVTLQQELDLVRSYLDIQRVYAPQLEISIHVDPHSFGTLVPNRLLLETVQTFTLQKRLDMQAVLEGKELKISYSNYEKEPVVLRIPLLPEDQMDQPIQQRGTPVESLEEFHRSLALQEKSIKQSEPSFWKKVWGIAALWTLIMSFFLARELIARKVAGEPLEVMNNIKDYAMWYWWAIFTPIIFWLGERIPIRHAQLARNITLHFLISFAVSLIMVLLYFGQRWVFGMESNWAMLLETLLRYPHPFDMLTYWAILGVREGLAYNWKYLQEELRTAKLKGNLLEAQVQALKMQLHPHFLFNTLNSISELMHEDMEAAEKMLKRLENFLRLTFQNSDVQQIPLQKELEFLQNYLEIQQVRFQNRLAVDLKIDPQALADRVPNLILQPIVENAIRHGIAPRTDAGRIEIRASHKSGSLLLQVEDDGPGLPALNFREGVGMSNTRMRLQQLYGKECSFQMQNNPQGGLVVTLQIPASAEPSVKQA